MAKPKQRKRRARSRPNTAVASQFYRGNSVSNPQTSSRLKQQRSARKKGKVRARRRMFEVRAKSGLKLVVGILLIVFLVTRVQLSSAVGSTAQDLPYKQDVEKFLATGIQRIKPFFDAGQLEQYIMARHTEVAEFDVSTSLLGTSVKYTAVRRESTALWLDERRAELYEVDQLGVAFNKITVIDPSLPLITDTSGLNVDSGTPVISTQVLQFITNLHLEAAKAGLSIKTVKVDDNPREILAELTGEGYSVKFNTVRTAKNQIADLITVREYLAKNNIAPNHYIDVRVVDKVFYR